VSIVTAAEGFKLLRPEARVRVCEGSLIAAFGMGGSDLLERAVRELLGSDAEADAVIECQVEWTWHSIGFYGWHCVTLRGDLVRTASTMLLPMPSSHHGH